MTDKNSGAAAPAPAAVEPVAADDFPHEQMDALALARYKVVPSDQSMFWRYAVAAGDGQQHLYNGSEVDCQNMARKFAGAFLDGAFVYHTRCAAPTTKAAPAPAADALDAETPYQRGYRHGYNRRCDEIAGDLL